MNECCKFQRCARFVDDCFLELWFGHLQVMFRCALMCKAALEAPWHVPCGGVPYGDENLVFIANDWHAALLPVYLQVDHGKVCLLTNISSAHDY